MIEARRAYKFLTNRIVPVSIETLPKREEEERGRSGTHGVFSLDLNLLEGLGGGGHGAEGDATSKARERRGRGERGRGGGEQGGGSSQ